MPSSLNSAHVDRLPRERVFSEAAGSPSTSRHPTPRQAGEFRRPPPPQGRSEAWSGCGPRGGPATSLRSQPRPRHPTPRWPGTKPAAAPRSPHNPAPGPVGCATRSSRAPHRAFSVGPELSGRRPLPPADEPLGPASGPGSPVRRPREARAALNRRCPLRGPAAGRGARVPHRRRGTLGWPQPHAPLSCSPPPPAAAANTRVPTQRPRCQPQPGRPASPAVPGLPGSAAHGAGSGGGNVNKSGFYSYLTLECRVHLLSARYQTPAAPSRVFSKAACAICVAEPSARAGALRRRRTQPAPAPCAAAPWPPQRYAGGAPGPLGRPAQPHLGLIGATPAAHRQRSAIHFADAPGVGEPRHRRELHRLAATGRN